MALQNTWAFTQTMFNDNKFKNQTISLLWFLNDLMQARKILKTLVYH